MQRRHTRVLPLNKRILRQPILQNGKHLLQKRKHIGGESTRPGRPCFCHKGMTYTPASVRGGPSRGRGPEWASPPLLPRSSAPLPTSLSLRLFCRDQRLGGTCAHQETAARSTPKPRLRAIDACAGQHVSAVRLRCPTLGPASSRGPGTTHASRVPADSIRHQSD